MGATTERRVTAFGETKTVAEWEGDRRAAVYGELILRRLEEGMVPEQAIAIPLPALERGPRKYMAWGERKTLRDWADDPRCAVSMESLRARLKLDWPPERALTQPVKKRVGVLVEAFGEAKTVAKWAEDERAAVGACSLAVRLKDGMPPEEAITTPPDHRFTREVTAFGETKDAEAWAGDPRCEVSAQWLLIRITRGLTPEEAMQESTPLPRRKRYTAWGETKGLADWARDARCVVCQHTLMLRLRSGMAPEAAITTPKVVLRPAKIAKNARLVTAWGETKVLYRWSQDPRCAISITNVAKRLEAGWVPEEALSTPSSLVPQLVEAFGETKKVSEWAHDPRCAVSMGCLYQRVAKGWESERALTTPSAEDWQSRPFEAFGETKTLKAWSEDARCRVGYGLLQDRLRIHGMALEVALVAAKGTYTKRQFGRMAEAFGERKLLGEWTGDARCVVSRKALQRRLRAGWELARALTVPEFGDRPVNVQGVFVEAFGERKNLRQWEKDPRCRVAWGVFKGRLDRGWDAERALTTEALSPGEVTVERGPRGAERRVTAWGETRRIGSWAKDPRCVATTKLLAYRLGKGWEAEEAMTTPAGGGRDEREARAAAWAAAEGRDGANALAMAFGEAKTVAGWAADARARTWGEAIRERLAYGVPPEEAITTPGPSSERKERLILAWGVRKSALDWSDDPRAAVSTGTIRHRIEGGWEPERAISTPLAEPSLRLMEAFGETKCLAAWGTDDRCRVSMWTIRHRLEEGWSLEDALKTPGREQMEGGLTAFGETKTLVAWSQDPRCEVGPSNIGARLKRGLSPEEAITGPSHLVKRGESTPDGATPLTAWGETKALNEWLGDARCVVGAATLRNRIAEGVVPEVALASPDASPWKDGVTAWGETKSIAAWARDPRCKVQPGQVAVRLGKGMPPEEAIGGESRASGLSVEERSVTAFGETKTVQAWSRDPRCSVRAETIRRRIETGMDAESAIASPKETGETAVTAWGETKRVSEWLEDARCVMTSNGLRTRLASGMPPEEAMTRPAPKRGEANLVEAFGERKTMQAWAADPRCRVTYTGLQKRLLKGEIGAEEAITRPGVEMDRERFEYAATAFGETKRMAEWIKDPRSSVTRGALTMRILRGWPLEDALTLPEGAIHPLKDHRRLLTAFGETRTVKDWSRDARCAVAESTITYRLDRGWTVTDALVTPVRGTKAA